MANDLLGCRLTFQNVLFCFWGQPDPTPRGSPSREKEVAQQSSARPCKGAAVWRPFLTSHETLCIPYQMFPLTCIISKTVRGTNFFTLPGRGPSDTWNQALPPDFPHLFLPSSGVRVLDQATPSFPHTQHISASESGYLLAFNALLLLPHLLQEALTA